MQSLKTISVSFRFNRIWEIHHAHLMMHLWKVHEVVCKANKTILGNGGTAGLKSEMWENTMAGHVRPSYFPTSLLPKHSFKQKENRSLRGVPKSKSQVNIQVKSQRNCNQTCKANGSTLHEWTFKSGSRWTYLSLTGIQARDETEGWNCFLLNAMNSALKLLELYLNLLDHRGSRSLAR